MTRLLPRRPATRCVIYYLRFSSGKGGRLVALYIMMSSLSESGRKVLRARPGWIRKVNREVERMGARIHAQYAVLGPYDFVTILEAPDNATVSRVSMELGARGSVQIMTLAAIPLETFIDGLTRPRTQPKKR